MRQGGYSLSINPRLQVQPAFWLGEDALVENDDVATTEGLRIRRARVGLFGSIRDELGLNMVLDLRDMKAGGSMIHAADIVYRPFVFLNFAVGTAPTPFSAGSMVSSAKLQLIERSHSVEEFSAGSQLGTTVMGRVAGGILEYAAGIYNGGPGYTYGDLGEGFMYVARLQAAPLGEIHPGESDIEGSPLRFAFGGDYYYNYDSSTRTHAVSADLCLKWRGLSLRGEWIYDHKEPEDKPDLPPAISDKTRRMGWYLQGGYFIVPALLELAARYEWHDDNIEIHDTGDLWLATGGLNLFLMEGHLKLQLNYVHKEERRERELSNDAIFGLIQASM